MFMSEMCLKQSKGVYFFPQKVLEHLHQFNKSLDLRDYSYRDVCGVNGWRWRVCLGLSRVTKWPPS